MGSVYSTIRLCRTAIADCRSIQSFDPEGLSFRAEGRPDGSLTMGGALPWIVFVKYIVF